MDSLAFEKISSWPEVTLDHLLVAFRKAKFEAFRAKPVTNVRAWVEFEEQVVENLTKLLAGLVLDAEKTICSALLVPPVLHPKSLTFGESGSRSDQLIYSDGFGRFKRVTNIRANTRVVGTYPPEAHVISALWVLTSGRSLCKGLTNAAYANRIKANDWSPRLFEPYQQAYNSWRIGAIRRAKQLLEADVPVTLLSCDVAAFYHNVDPLIFKQEVLLAQIDGKQSSFQEAFTSLLVDGIDLANKEWTTCYAEVENLGLPIGLTASSVLANVLLRPLDRKFEELSPYWYGRYVDDIVVAIDDSRGASLESKNGQEESTIISRLLPTLFEKDTLKIDGLGGSNLSFASEKERVFFLSGSSGKELLANIDAEINRASSEFRFAANEGEPFEPSTILSVAREASEAPLSLRRTANITVRRFKLVQRLADLELKASLLLPEELLEEVRQFTVLLRDYVLTPIELFAFFPYLSRFDSLLSRTSAVCGHISDAESDLLQYAERALDELKAAEVGWEINGRKVKPGRSGEMIVRALSAAIRDVAPPKVVEERELQLLWRARIERLDWGPQSWKEVETSKPPGLPQIPPGAPRFRSLAASIKKVKCLVPFQSSALLFPTRPFLPVEIALIDGGESDKEILSTASLLRGWIRQRPKKKSRSNHRPKKVKPLLVVTSLLTKEQEPLACALGRTRLSLERWNKIVRLFGAIWASPTFQEARKVAGAVILLPELSLPRCVLAMILRTLSLEKISLMAGVEYSSRQLGATRRVRNECVILSGAEPGWQWVPRFHTKRSPAVSEGLDLINKAGVDFDGAPRKSDAEIYDVAGMKVGVLVCSELLDISRRAKLRGKIDLLFVPAWNRDLNTFDALVNSSSLDLHAFVAVANNRMYGDSRVRSPAKEDWKRDLCRVRGGEDDYFVSVFLDVMSLRSFQSRAKMTGSSDDPYKPVPDGFEMDVDRRCLPR